MEFQSLREMADSLEPAVRWDETVRVMRPAELRGRPIDRLVWTAVFASDAELRETAR